MKSVEKALKSESENWFDKNQSNIALNKPCHDGLCSIGIGLKNGAEVKDFNDLINNWPIRPVSSIATISMRGNHPVIIHAMQILSVPLKLYTAEQLNLYKNLLKNPSELVFKRTGCYGVAESAALAVFDGKADIIVEKHIYHGITIAITKAWQ